jgi:tetratricopeptide (TPR) repeat protein
MARPLHPFPGAVARGSRAGPAQRNRDCTFHPLASFRSTLVSGIQRSCGVLPIRRIRRVFLAFLLASVSLLAASCTTTSFEFDSWHEIKTDHFSVITNTTERRAIGLARTLEFYRSVVLRLVPLHHVEDRVPTRFYLFRSENSYKPFQLDRGVVGYFMQPLDGNVLVANLSPPGLRPVDVVFHEYAHLLLRNQNTAFPTWFDEGFAEFLSTMSVSEGAEVEFGGPPLRRVSELRDPMRAGHWLPLAQILKTRSLHEIPSEVRPFFYAQSWLAVHFMYLAHLSRPEYPDYSEALGHYLEMLNEGSSPEAAWRGAFRISPEEMDEKMRAYFAAGNFPSLRYAERDFGWSDAVDTRDVPRPEMLRRLGELLLALGRTIDATQFMRRALAIEGESARALAGLARASESSDEREGLFERAQSADPEDGIVCGWRAGALADALEAAAKDGAAPPDAGQIARARELARRCVALRPDLPLGHVIEGRLLRLADGDPERAIASLERALALLPSNPATALSLGELYADTGRLDQALRLLRRVEQLAPVEELSAQAARRIAALEDAERPELPVPDPFGAECAGGCSGPAGVPGLQE